MCRATRSRGRPNEEEIVTRGTVRTTRVVWMPDHLDAHCDHQKRLPVCDFMTTARGRGVCVRKREGEEAKELRNFTAIGVLLLQERGGGPQQKRKKYNDTHRSCGFPSDWVVALWVSQPLQTIFASVSPFLGSLVLGCQPLCLCGVKATLQGGEEE